MKINKPFTKESWNEYNEYHKLMNEKALIDMKLYGLPYVVPHKKSFEDYMDFCFGDEKSD